MDKFSPRDCADLLFVRDMPSNCVKHEPDAWCMAGDFFFFFLLLEMTDVNKLKSKREVIMEKRIHDTCQHKYGL